jgi:hypothetical protein
MINRGAKIDMGDSKEGRNDIQILFGLDFKALLGIYTIASSYLISVLVPTTR